MKIERIDILVTDLPTRLQRLGSTRQLRRAKRTLRHFVGPVPPAAPKSRVLPRHPIRHLFHMRT